MPLLLRTDEVASLLDMASAIDVVENAFAEQARAAVGQHSPYHLAVTGGALRVTSGALYETGKMGVRTGTALGLTSPSGAANHLCILYDTDGELRGVMGYPFGTLRTAAAMASSVKRLARADAETIGLIGSGRSALALLEGVMVVRPIKLITVFSRDPERRKRFCEQAAKKLGIPVLPVDTPQPVVCGPDIIITASSQREPLFPAEWLQPGVHLSSMGPIGEIHEDAFMKADRIVVTSREQEEGYYVPSPPFPLVELIRAGKMSWKDVDELGDVIDGRAPGRVNPDDITLFHESQGGITDIALATHAFNEATRRGLGREFAI